MGKRGELASKKQKGVEEMQQAATEKVVTSSRSKISKEDLKERRENIVLREEAGERQQGTETRSVILRLQDT